MTDIKSPGLIKAKGVLFACLAALASSLLLLRRWDPVDAVLLGIALWAACRAYYFAFYVIERYVDPSFRFAGLWDFLVYLARGKTPPPDAV
ncbi:MAG: hypothetical protein HYZ75_01455 [Elusimicrobia bacterium]|nr:hypothetical protein [Elusimicrobiota bacterium]